MTREDFEDEITLILDSETGSDNTFHVDALMACYDDQRALIEQQAKELFDEKSLHVATQLCLKAQSESTLKCAEKVKKQAQEIARLREALENIVEGEGLWTKSDMAHEAQQALKGEHL